MKIIPVASGKGGVGKRSLAANLAVLLAAKGKVILVDADLGSSNLHLLLGMRRIDKGIGSFLTGNSSENLASYLMATGYDNLQFIPGDSGIPGMANIDFAKKKALINQLLKLEADYLIIDLGAGSAFNTLDFFLISNAALLVTSPTAAAALSAYLFLKNAVFRIITASFPAGSAGYNLMEELKKGNLNLQYIDISKLKTELAKVDSQNYAEFERLLNNFNPMLVVNMLSEPSEAARAERLKASCLQHLGVKLELLGVVFRDDSQNKALAGGLPVVRYKPQGVMSRALMRIATKLEEAVTKHEGNLLNTENLAKEPLTTTEVEEDYRVKAEGVADLYINEAISEGDMLETLRVQQYELNQLRKENRYLKHKIVELMKK